MIRLLCFPFSGGSAISYRGLGASFDSITVSTFELPGRGRRFSEPVLDTIERMVDDLFLQLQRELGAPYALYGHSMGATLAYLVAKRLIRERLRQPVCLFVSGSKAPSVMAAEGRHLLPTREFHQTLAELGGCPPAILADQELMALYEPVLRADFGALASYRYEDTTPLHFPITALIGMQDKVSEDEARQWQRETVWPLRLERFSGDHFFIFQHWHEIRRLFSEQLQQAAAFGACRPFAARDGSPVPVCTPDSLGPGINAG